MTLSRWTGAAAAAAALGLAAAPQAGAQENYLGEIIMVGANFCPRYTLPADGQLLAIAENTALFSLYGTMYGGDGRTSFGLPDLRGHAPVHSGQYPGQDNRQQGSREVVTVPPVAGKRAQESVANGEAKQVATLGIRYCVVTNGIYPSRS